MKVGILFSGGKDSTYAAWLAKKEGYEIECLITIFSKNKESFMFHTPAIELTRKQAELMRLPLITRETEGEKEKELRDLEKAIEKAMVKHNIQGIVTGAVASNYQASRILDICDRKKITCINPLWDRSPEELLREMIESKFEVIISAVGAYPLDKKWLGRKIDNKFVEDIKELHKKYKVSMNGEGGEFESLVINCPMFKEKLRAKIIDIEGEGNAWRAVFD